MQSLKILIQGAGALGSLLGFHLAAAGHDVTLGFRRRPDAWPHHEDSPILSLVSKNCGTPRSVPVRLVWPGEPFPDTDLLLLTTKAQDAEDASLAAKHSLIDGGVAVLLSNGLGLEPAISSHFPTHLILRGLAYCGALLDSPGVVRCTGEGKIHLGVCVNQGSGESSVQDRLHSTAKVFSAAGMPVEIVADIRRALWEKAMANLVINPLGALARVRNGAVGTEERFQGIARDILKEATAIAAAEGIRIDLDEAVQIFRTTAAATAENENSMLRDILSGKQTEIAHLNGHVVRKGKEKEIPVPTNESLVEQIEALHPAQKS